MLRQKRPDAWALCLGGVLIGALVLRLWGIKHGLPYVFNVDEASNFVPTAISFWFTDSHAFGPRTAATRAARATRRSPRSRART